jgi:hypothetical protein
VVVVDAGVDAGKAGVGAGAGVVTGAGVVGGGGCDFLIPRELSISAIIFCSNSPTFCGKGIGSLIFFLFCITLFFAAGLKKILFDLLRINE